jgi:hypothetical protein
MAVTGVISKGLQFAILTYKVSGQAEKYVSEFGY